MSRYLKALRLNTITLLIIMGSMMVSSQSLRADERANGQIIYVPFKIEEIINPLTGLSCKAGDVIEISLEGKLIFKGVASDLLQILNDTEKEYNRIGQSLRNDGKLLILQKLTDGSSLNTQYLNDLGLRASLLKDKVKTALDNCDLITIANLGVNPRSAQSYLPIDKVVLPDGRELSAAQFVARINDQQRVLCSLGYSLFDKIGGVAAFKDEADAVEKILSFRDDKLNELGISKFDEHFNLEAMEEIKSYNDVAKEITSLVDARKVPGPEQLQELRSKISRELPEDLKIPDLPNIPQPVAPKRMPLAVKKKKLWNGINEGSHNTFAVYSSAFYEISGSETEEQAIAEGTAGAFVFGNDINALFAHADLYAGPADLHGNLILRALGQDIIAPKTFHESVVYTWSDPRALVWDFDKSYDYQFSVGPVPVCVSAGARTSVWVGWEVGLTTTQLHGSVLPGADAEGYVLGGVGFAKFLSAGAEGSLTIIDLHPDLTGSAGITFDPAGVPYLKLALNSDVGYNYLSGKVMAYAEYPVPRWGIPPWKRKKSHINIFDWPGQKGTRKIMSWTMDVGSFGARTSGDLLDQRDYEEAAALQTAITLDQRKLALNQMAIDVAVKERTVLTHIMTDLGGASATRIQGDQQFLAAAARDADQTRSDYLTALIDFTK